MNYNMNLQRNSQNTAIKHSKTKSHVQTASSSSDYSTCSDNPKSNWYWNKQESLVSRESDILAGHLVLNETSVSTVLEDTNFSVGTLDLNVNESDDVFDDCIDYSASDNDSTIYIPIEEIFNSKKHQSDLSNNNSNSSQREYQETTNASTDYAPAIGLHERLITIIEEKEITNTTGCFVKDLSSNQPTQNTGQLLSKMIDEIKTPEEQNNNCTKKVLFVNVDDVADDDENDALEPKKTSKSPNTHTEWPPTPGKTNCNHNTTASFLLWEKYCEASEKMVPRRSFSFTQLSTATESCSGDDEYSTEYKTIDDMQVSRSSPQTKNYKSSSHQKNMIYRSKSCESILREVKHLPHLMYDRFLKYLSEEIDRIRQEHVVCTCPKWSKKNSDKENERRSPKKTGLKLTNKLTHVKSSGRESKLPLQVGNYAGTGNTSRLLPKATNSTRLSPTATTNRMRLSTEPTNRSRLSPGTTNRKRLSPVSANGSRLSPVSANGSRLSPVSANGSRLSPEAANRMILSPGGTSKNLSQLQTSSISPMKTPTAQSRSRYFWNKQIISPVGEYIRGKRQSPYQSSPSKKK